MNHSTFSVFFVAVLAAFTAGCPTPGVQNPPVDPIDVTPTTAFPCGAFTDIPLNCTSDVGEHRYKFDLQAFCDEAGAPLMVVTAASATTPEPFQLGASCTINTDTWTINDASTEAAIDCTDHWGDGSNTRYEFTLSFTSNTTPLHGRIYFRSTYMDSTTTYTPGYSDCTF